MSRTGTERNRTGTRSAEGVRRTARTGERPVRTTRTEGSAVRREGVRSLDRPVRRTETTDRTRSRETVQRRERIREEEREGGRSERARSLERSRDERRVRETDRPARRKRQTRPAVSGLALMKPQSTLDAVMLGIKVLMLVFLVFYIVKIYGMGQAKDLPLTTIEEKLVSSTDVNALTKRGVIDLKRSYSLSADDLEEFVLYSADSLMDVSELLIIKVKDPDQLPAARQAVQRHLDTEMEKFDGYGTNQYDLLEHAIVLEKGRYLFCAVSENDKQWEEVFLSCVG